MTQERILDHLPQGAYRPVILRVLLRMGDRGKTGEVCRQVFDDIEHRLRPGDFKETLSNQWPHWRNRACWERNAMVTDGLLRTDSPHGVWELTDAGRREAQTC